MLSQPSHDLLHWEADVTGRLVRHAAGFAFHCRALPMSERDLRGLSEAELVAVTVKQSDNGARWGVLASVGDIARIEQWIAARAHSQTHRSLRELASQAGTLWLRALNGTTTP